jgi:hypothetical protein
LQTCSSKKAACKPAPAKKTLWSRLQTCSSKKKAGCKPAPAKKNVTPAPGGAGCKPAPAKSLYLMALMQNLLISLDTYSKLGMTNLLRVFWYKLKLKTGVVRKQLPIGKSYVGDFFSIQLPHNNYNFSRKVVLRHAENLLQGRHTFFSHQSVQLGAPPNWHGNLSGVNSIHWSQIGDFDSGDIKLIWEPSRFDWVVIFARAWLVSGEKKYLNALNSWLVDWVKQNPVNQGVNWKCGQETSIRLMQLLLAAKLLDQHKQPSECLIRFVSEHCQRIASTLAYAMAQNNNHGTSEAAALFIGGSWLEGHHKKAKDWQTIGQRWLENRAKYLIETDGSFSQYSVNYHRVVLDTFWMVEFWRRELGKNAFSERFYNRARMATHWLYQMVDPKTGDAPNLGNNDGARLFLLTDTDYRDFRPTLQVASVLFYGKPLFSLQHKVSEGLYWLGLCHNIEIASEPPQQSQLFKEGGYAILLNNNSKAIIRFPRFKFRPSHADALHIDLWHKGQNLLRDSGSYSYNTEKQWLKYFPGTRSHNTIEFDERDQMPKVSRFLFGKWLTTDLLTEIEEKGEQLCWSASYTDYKGCSHHRQICVSGNRWKITDTVSGLFNKAVLRWRLMPDKWIIQNNICQSDKAKIQIICNVDIQRLEMTEGWESRYYLDKTPLPVLEVEIGALGNGVTSARLTTAITLLEEL